MFGAIHLRHKKNNKGHNKCETGKFKGSLEEPQQGSIDDLIHSSAVCSASVKPTRDKACDEAGKSARVCNKMSPRVEVSEL